MKRSTVISVIVIGTLFGGGFAIYWQNQMPAIPMATQMDLTANSEAGSVHKLKGQVFLRSSRPQDFENLGHITSQNELEKNGFIPLEVSDPVYLGAVIRLFNSSIVELSTAGLWGIILDGDGEFIFEESGTDQVGELHVQRWYVKQGQFRARPKTSTKGDYWLEISTAKGLVRAHQGEFGIRVSEQSTQVWNISADLTLVPRKGKEEKLLPKNLGYL